MGANDTITAYYLPKKLENRGRLDGSDPSRVAVPERSVLLHASEKRSALEQAFSAANYHHPRGNGNLNKFNNEVWKKALKPLLVAYSTAKAITRGDLSICSGACSSEDGN